MIPEIEIVPEGRVFLARSGKWWAGETSLTDLWEEAVPFTTEDEAREAMTRLLEKETNG